MMGNVWLRRGVGGEPSNLTIMLNTHVCGIKNTIIEDILNLTVDIYYGSLRSQQQ